MRKLLLILLCLPIVVLAQKTYVPDDNFEQELINMGYDTGPLDDSVLTANISSVINLFIGASNISDLTGIEDFASLSDLSCWGNQLTTLDVSNNTNLIQLDCSANPLNSLNVTGLTALLWMYTDFCQLTSLDVSTNISLEELDFEWNQISSIDLSNNTALISLYCTFNQLISLDLSLNTALEFLICRDNQLTCLNLSNINQQNMTGFIAYNNPCLYCIEVDDPIWATANWTPSGLNIDPIASFSVNCPGNCTSLGNGYPFTMDICQGDSIFLEGSFQTNTGIYYDTLLTINSCDSIILTTLTILPVTINSISYDICQGDSLLAGGSYQTNTGIYYDTLVGANSCDSIIITNLNVLLFITNAVSYYICQGDSLLAGGSYQTNTGTYYDTLLTINSCDSIIITSLNMLSSTINVLSYDIYQGDSLFVGGSYQTNAGIYYDTLVAANSCDSIIISELMVYELPTINAFISGNDTICDNGKTDAEVLFYFSGVSPYTFIYKLNGITQPPVITSVNPHTISTKEAGIYILQSFSDANEIGGVSGEALVTVLKSPVANFALQPDNMTILYTTTQCIDKSIGDIISWQWDFGDNTPIDFSEFPYHTYKDSLGIYQVSLIINDNKGCVDTSFKHIQITDDYWVYIPNSFTPDKDGLNDRLCISYNGIREATFNFNVYDRFSNLVYSTHNIHDLDCVNGWDGTHQETLINLPMGVYIYQIYYQDFEGWKHQETSEIIIIR